MACMTCHYYSSVLGSNIAVSVIIPTSGGNERIVDKRIQKQYGYESNLPVVYLLHGAYGDFNSWLRFSNIERCVQERCCAAVMTSADDNFHQDIYRGPKCRTSFTEELPAFIINISPVSKKREDTFIAGFSMGDYGAWYLALSTPTLYAKFTSMSDALDIVALYEQAMNGSVDSPFPWNDVYEDPKKLAGSDKGLLELYSGCQKSGLVLELYQACGTEDFLYDLNVSVKNRMEQVNASLACRESPGGHNWDFWNVEIRDTLDWMLKGRRLALPKIEHKKRG